MTLSPGTRDVQIVGRLFCCDEASPEKHSFKRPAELNDAR